MVLRCLGMVSVCLSWLSCSLLPDPHPADRVVIASWNVQNLFDEVADGGEYPEFDPSRGWTRAQFWGRCEALARVIRTLGPGGPDILVLEEVEGAHALEVLRTRFLNDLGYRHWFLAPDTVPGIKTAILSRYGFVRTGLHLLGTGEVESLRPLVEVEIDWGGRPLVVLGNHWKSRIPTPAATEALRRIAAQALARRIATLESRGDSPLVVAAGDFNTSLELSRSRPDRALVPGGSDRPDLGLVVYSKKAKALGALAPGVVWDPWELEDDPPGSYVYQGDWDRLDHIFVAASGLRWGGPVVGSFEAVAYAATPQAYGVRTPQGVSDHFPVVLTLVRGSDGIASP